MDCWAAGDHVMLPDEQVCKGTLTFPDFPRPRRQGPLLVLQIRSVSCAGPGCAQCSQHALCLKIWRPQRQHEVTARHTLRPKAMQT